MQKKKKKKGTRQREVFSLPSTCWNGGNRIIWDGICGERKKRERHLLNQSLVVDKFSKTSTWHHSNKQTGGEKFLDYLKIAMFTLPIQLVGLLD